MDDLSHQLGSSVLLDDSDEILPTMTERRPPGPPGLRRDPTAMSAFGASPIFAQATAQQRMDGFALGSTSNNGSSWGTPPSNLFAQGPMSPGTWGAPSSGWPSGPPSSGLGNGIGMGTSLGSLNRSRPIVLRTTVCNLFRQLTMSKLLPPSGFQDVASVLQVIEHHNQVKPPPSIQELLNILDTEGNEHNGGGTFTLQIAQVLEMSLVRWNPPEERPLGGLGEIGSSGGIGAPPGLFPGLGANLGGFH